MPTGHVASTTTAQPVGSQSRPSLFTRLSSALRQAFFNSADLEDPKKLYEVLHQLQSNLGFAVRGLASNPLASGTHLTGLPFKNGVPLLIPHGLGRPYLGYVVTRATAQVSIPVDVGMPPGVSTRDCLNLVVTNDATIDLYVFG